MLFKLLIYWLTLTLQDFNIVKPMKGNVHILYLQGGMKAVIWTDVFQAVVMFTGMMAIVIQVYVNKLNICVATNVKLHVKDVSPFFGSVLLPSFGILVTSASYNFSMFLNRGHCALEDLERCGQSVKKVEELNFLSK